ncbi:MAG: lamin tail domain-containing protein [Calditrichaeota bacterium]|nr:lamin tail domain-containing protein [Calditrichota bacterium]
MRDLLLFVAILSGCLTAQVTFTEIMYDPSTNESHDEFIEIYNLSDSVLDLSGWSLSDSLSSDNLADAGNGMILNAHQYAVILDGSYFGNSETYDMIIPDSALIITIADKGFGRSGLTNSSPKLLSLHNTDSAIIDQYRYSIGNPPGYSEEKKILSAGNNQENWSNALVEGGTPGFRNSVAPFSYDLAFVSISWKPASNITINQAVAFEIKITNSGINRITEKINIKLFIDSDKDGKIALTDTQIADLSANIDLDVKQEHSISYNYAFNQSAEFNIIAILESESDQNTYNNRIDATLIILDDSSSPVINEIKFLTNEDEPEWIELYNPGDNPVLMTGWSIADSRDTSAIDSFIYIQPGQYKVFAKANGVDSLYNIAESLIVVLKSLPVLNNNSDIIYLLNPAGGWQEQVPYTINWLEGEEKNNPSLERINHSIDSRKVSNWGPSVDVNHATPARKNSIYTESRSALESTLNISPNPFSPDHDGYEDHTIITLQIPVSTARIRVQIFDILGRKITTLMDNAFSGSESKIVWDGKDSQGRIVRMGIYIVFCQILNDREGIIKEEKTTIVVAGKLQ